MDVKSIKEILNLVNKSDLSEVEIEHKDFKIRVKKGSGEDSIVYSSIPMQAPQIQAIPQPLVPQFAEMQAPAAIASAATSGEEGQSDNLFTFKSPMIGTFYRASGPDKDSFINVGETITPGKVLCIIEAMKLFNEIESEESGKIVKILVDDASPVEYDQPLFLIERS